MPVDRPSLLLRSDASAGIGTGHVVRCLTLAGELIGRGWTVALTGRMPDGLAAAATEQGVRVHRLPDDLDLADEPARLVADGTLDGVDLVLSDHYGIAAGWQRAVAGGGRRVAAIDDLATEPMAVDLLLNQNLGATAERYAALLPRNARVLAGPRYALVRPGFAEAAAGRPVRTGEVDRILVFLSGADVDDVTGRAAQAAAGQGRSVDVVVGSAYPFVDRLRAWAAERPGVTVHVDTPAMPELMAAADLAIGAPSSASWERCTLGLPSVLVILADNQVEVAGLLDAAGAAWTLGWHHDVTTREMTDAIAALRADPIRLRAMGHAAAAITDGLGAARVADELEALVAGDPRRPTKGAAR